ncbi:hypothetical protein J2X65_000193 [Ancylobacter sp. 3268]|uniref:hypothetical protein n=1 Tax=Ancylobacter sp. 3268 TaxID=2817752 RepID=UPI0028604673|nr:hypothetical protein [Ancylobacter sp. 3268]MDR6950850.1 hypothetical protein [Ancylobacter sp. 3268]
MPDNLLIRWRIYPASAPDSKGPNDRKFRHFDRFTAGDPERGAWRGASCTTLQRDPGRDPE